MPAIQHLHSSGFQSPSHVHNNVDDDDCYLHHNINIHSNDDDGRVYELSRIMSNALPIQRERLVHQVRLGGLLTVLCVRTSCRTTSSASPALHPDGHSNCQHDEHHDDNHAFATKCRHYGGRGVIHEASVCAHYYTGDRRQQLWMYANVLHVTHLLEYSMWLCDMSVVLEVHQSERHGHFHHHYAHFHHYKYDNKANHQNYYCSAIFWYLHDYQDADNENCDTNNSDSDHHIHLSVVLRSIAISACAAGLWHRKS